MGFFDRDVENGFDGMFDWNRDGKLDSFEQANQFEFEEELMRDSDSDYDEDDELEMAGLDSLELELMDEDERREALEDAGLDPDDYDF